MAKYASMLCCKRCSSYGFCGCFCRCCGVAFRGREFAPAGDLPFGTAQKGGEKAAPCCLRPFAALRGNLRQPASGVRRVTRCALCSASLKQTRRVSQRSWLCPAAQPPPPETGCRRRSQKGEVGSGSGRPARVGTKYAFAAIYRRCGSYHRHSNWGLAVSICNERFCASNIQSNMPLRRSASAVAAIKSTAKLSRTRMRLPPLLTTAAAVPWACARLHAKCSRIVITFAAAV